MFRNFCRSAFRICQIPKCESTIFTDFFTEKLATFLGSVPKKETVNPESKPGPHKHLGWRALQQNLKVFSR